MTACFIPIAFMRWPASLPADSSSCPMCMRHPSFRDASNPELIEITGIFAPTAA
jgi:hypothetical protein